MNLDDDENFQNYLKNMVKLPTRFYQESQYHPYIQKNHYPHALNEMYIEIIWESFK